MKDRILKRYELRKEKLDCDLSYLPQTSNPCMPVMLKKWNKEN